MSDVVVKGKYFKVVDKEKEVEVVSLSNKDLTLTVRTPKGEVQVANLIPMIDPFNFKEVSELKHCLELAVGILRDRYKKTIKEAVKQMKN